MLIDAHANVIGLLGIEPLLEPPSNQLKDDHNNRVESTSTPQSSSSQMDELIREVKDLKISIPSAVGEHFSSVLAIQARRGTDIASPSPKRVLYVPHPSLNRSLRKFLGNPKATFKTPEQAEALEITMSGKRHLLLVGPTAMGKSLVYMLPAAERSQGITVVLLPLSALHLDFERRCSALQIESSRWSPKDNEKPRTKIVYVSPEHAQTSMFIDYLVETFHIGLLVQIVIDEVHLVQTHSKFRYCLSLLKPLVSSGERSPRTSTSLGTS